MVQSNESTGNASLSRAVAGAAPIPKTKEKLNQ